MHACILSPQDLSASDIARWRELQAASHYLRSPFYSYEFARAIADARGDVTIAVMRRGREIIGFFPFHRLSGGVAKPVGGPISDYQGPVLAPDVEVDGPELLRACGLSAYDFNHAPCAISALRSGAVHFSQSPYIDLRGGYATYIANRPKAGRHAVKETERRMRRVTEEVGELRFELHDDAEAVWPALVAMKNASYERIGVVSGLGIGWIDRALARLRSVGDGECRGLVSTLYAGDRLIAAHMGMRTATTLCWWFNTYDYELRNRAPGLILLLKAIERAAAEGIEVIDFGRGDEPYKLAFANGATDLCEGSIECTSTVPGVLRRAQKATLKGLSHVPLGRYESWPRRAMARLSTGMRLPA